MTLPHATGSGIAAFTLRAIAAIYDIETPFFAVIKEAIRRTGLDISTVVLPPGRLLSGEATGEPGQLLHASQHI